MALCFWNLVQARSRLSVDVWGMNEGKEKEKLKKGK